MKRIADFEKVSFDRFYEDGKKFIPNKETSKAVYDRIQLPTRATSGSAGYDFKSPLTFNLAVGESIKIPTGIRVCIENGWFLGCFPRSSLGFKYRLQLDNTTGIIDSDYFYSDNEGHIFAKITNDGKEGKVVEIKEGDAFMQGIFIPYGITTEDYVTDTRNGGEGSTNKF